MSKKDKRALILTTIGITLSIITMAIFIPKIKKIEDEEKNYQYETIGYYSSLIETNKERQKKKDTYSAIATIPILITTCGTCMYWIPTLLNLKEDKKNENM